MNEVPVRILLVEDEPAHVLVIRRAFEESTLKVSIEIAGTLQEFRQSIAAHPPDIAIVDWKLPDGNGIEVLTSPPEDLSFPILIITNYGSEEMAVQALKAGALDYIVKSPEAFERMPQTVRRVLREWQLIMERKCLHEALQKSEDRYRDLVEKSHDLICTHDLEGKLLFVNEAAVRLSGYTREEMMKRNLRDFLAPEVRDYFPLYLEEIRSKGQVSGVMKVINAAGEFRYWEFNNNLRTEGVASPLVRGMAHDITDRLLTEKALRENENLFRKLFENHAAVKLLIDLDTGKIMDANKAAENFYGWSREQIKQMKIWEINTLSPEEVKKEMEKARAKKRIHFEFRHRRADGSIRDVDVYSSKIAVKGKDLLHSVIHDITERKRSEEALRESEEKYRQVVENAHEAIYVSQDEIIKFCNPKTRELLGYSNENLPDPFMLKDFIHPEDLALVKERHHERLRGKSVSPVYPFRIVDRKGSIKWVEINAATITWEGRPAALVFLTDITERKTAEEKILQAKEEWERTFDSVPDLIAIVDNDFRISRVNRAMADRLNLTFKEIIGRYCYEVFHGLKKPSSYCPHGEVLQEKKEISAEVMDPHLRGFFHVTSTPLLGTNSIIHVFRDISERKMAEDGIRQSEEKFRTLFNQASDCILIMDPAFKDPIILEANEAAHTMHGYAPGELIGKPISFLDTPESKKQIAERMAKLLSQKELSGEALHVRKDGSTFPIEISARLISMKGKTYIQAIDRDITERKKAEEEIKISLEKLRKAMGGIVQAMAATVEAKDPYTAGHQRRVADLARAIAQEMGLSGDQVDGLRFAGEIHDLGKIAVPAEILSKPTKLSEIEFSLIKVHAQAGYNILKEIDFPWPIARMVLEHHERMNGSGYPHGLKGDDMLQETKILIVADVVEAIASHRPYRPAHGVDKALEEIEKNKGVLYDPAVVETCLRLFRDKGYRLDG